MTEYCCTTSVYKGDKADSNNFRGTSHIDAIQSLYHYFRNVTAVRRRKRSTFPRNRGMDHRLVPNCTSVWLRLGTSGGGLMWTRQWTFGFHTTREMFWLFEEILVSQGWCFVEMVTYDVVTTEVLCNTAGGLVWFRRGISAWLLRNFGSHKMRGIDLLVRRLAVSTSGIQRQLLKIDKFNHTWKSSKTATRKWDLMFTPRWGSRLQSPRMWRLVVRYTWSSVSGKPVAPFSV
jgi:hypothetical protein